MTPDPLAGCDGYTLLRAAAGPGLLKSFIARDVGRDQDVLVELFPAHLLTDRAALDRLREVADTLAALDHPNIAVVIDIGRTPAGRAFVVTELGAGHLLGEQVGHGDGALPLLRVLDIAGGALRGLEAAHAAGIVHGALSLDMVCLWSPAATDGATAAKRRPFAKVLGFGISEVLQREGVQLSSHGAELSSEGPPSAGDPRVDVYGMGAVVYELVAGRSPHEDAPGQPPRKGRARHALEPPSHYASRAAEPELDAVVLRSLESELDDRYQSAAAFRAALERVASRIHQVSLPGTFQPGAFGLSDDRSDRADPTPSWDDDAGAPAFSKLPGGGDDDDEIVARASSADRIARRSSPPTARRRPPLALVALLAAAAAAALVLALYLAT